MIKIAIVGANSYIARNLICYIKNRYNIIQLYLYDRTDNHIDGEDNYTQVNVVDEESVKKIDFSCDLIFMFVGKTGTLAGFDEFDTFIDVNEKALLTLLNEYRRRNSNSKIIFPSTMDTVIIY